MLSIMRRGLMPGLMIITLLLALVVVPYAGAVSYTYDDLNRLVRVEYGDGTVIEYAYDSAGNRLQRTVHAIDTTPPTTTATPAGGLYNAPQSVTLTCNDGTGSGCDKIYYTTDGTTPTTSSPIYASPISASTTTALTFFSRDLAGNSESVKSQTYTIDTMAPTLAPVASQTTLWPPDHKMVPVTIQANANDNSGMPVKLTAAIACNESEKGVVYWTNPVIDQSTGVISLSLMADRFRNGTGRQYTITITAADQSGNASTANVKILVPHDQGRK